ncbi:adrenocortical dysplasia protein homolog [Cyclopterus lumpus]|uniref:adrenocortical dysplasia protein homolog n=1 Tax=Cyclopterus lumpus TaxID=8103 RepID=UPI0014874793|nr:adrenocortical dysplasia protein homolog [Cyclopterus lumpus]XP_034389927.1 adrenocortical dysplasia protein homolog [Cyclopterus lumpus]XP_034389928.1 adrenocortical dysplasia protein homolog [Cyclopterus lumpus]
MHRPARSRLSPWIESLILSYGSQEESVIGRLKAHVIGVGQMSQSQALGSEGPTGLLFLSDGLVQIPAILTVSAWEHLQEQEDRECFTSLVNTTVCIQDYELRFHMDLEQTKSRFVLSVGELATTAAGPVKDSTPCSTTLPSVRMKICKTWRALLGQETQDSQCGFDLSELLGEWQHDCLQAVLDDVRERLAAASPQPSTSTSPPTHPDIFAATSWAVDQVRYKGVKGFSVPMKCLLIPEEDAQQMQTPPNVGSRTTNGLSAASDDRARDSRPPSETTAPSVDDAEWRIATPAVVESDRDADETSLRPAEDSMLQESEIAVMIDCDIRSLSSLWDLHLPPCETSSCSNESPTPSPQPQHPAAPELRSDHSGILASPQLPVHSPKDSQQTSEHSNLPPYQKLPAASLTSVSPPEAFPRTPDLPPASDECCINAAQQTLPALDQQSPVLEKDVEEAVEEKYRKAQRKRSEPTPEADEEEAPISGSPPSWLFDSQGGSGADEGSSPGEGAVSRKRPTAHSDGRQFSYSYQLSGQNLQDFSRFKVTESLLHWAVKHLVVPKQTGDPVNSNQTSSDVTSL